MRVAIAAVFASIVAVAGCCCPLAKVPPPGPAAEEQQIGKVMVSSFWKKPPTKEKVEELIAQIRALDRDRGEILFIDHDGETSVSTFNAATDGGRLKTIIAPAGMGERVVYVFCRTNATRLNAARDLAKAVGP